MTVLAVQPSILFPNFVDSSFVNVAAGYNRVVFSGGAWLAARPLTFLQNYFVNKKARSTSAAVANTWFHVDLGTLRDVSGIVITDHNIKRTGKVRIRSSTKVAWSGVTVNGVNTVGDATLSVNTTLAISVKKGDGLLIAGDTNVYQASADVSIAASSTGIISIERVGLTGTGLVVATVGGEAITCTAGDYVSYTNVDTGFEDVWKVIYPFGTLPYGHPSLADGKITEEDASEEKIPHISFPGTSVDRYWRIDIQDSTNTDGYIDISRLFLARSIEPSLGMIYGSNLSWFSDTTIKKSKGGARIANPSAAGKKFTMGLKDIPEDEAMASIFSLTGKAGLHKQVFVCFNKNDTLHLHRRSLLATFERMDNPMNFSNFAVCDSVFNVQEVIA